MWSLKHFAHCCYKQRHNEVLTILFQRDNSKRSFTFLNFFTCGLLVGLVTVADYISRAESQSRQLTSKEPKKNKDMVSTLFNVLSDTIRPSLSIFVQKNHQTWFCHISHLGSGWSHRRAQPSAGTVHHQWSQQLHCWQRGPWCWWSSKVFHQEACQSVLRGL